MKTEVPPRILALRDHYLMVLRSKTDTELLVYVASKIGHASDRHLFIESVKGMTGIPLMRKCIEVCAANHRGETVPRIPMVSDTITIIPPPSNVFTHSNDYMGMMAKGPIVMPPNLRSDKKKRVSDPIVTVEEEWILNEEISHLIESERFKSDQIADAIIQQIAPLPKAIILPSPMPNALGSISGIQAHVLPKEEKEFGRLTKREKGKKVSAVVYDAPAPNSDRGAFGRVEPGSGQYQMVSPIQDETVSSHIQPVGLAVLKKEERPFDAFMNKKEGKK